MDIIKAFTDSWDAIQKFLIAHNINLTSFISVIIAIITAVLAVYNAYKKKELKKTLREIQRVQNLETWTNINMVLKTYQSLEEIRDKLRDSIQDADSLWRYYPELLSRISSARRGTVDEWRFLLMQAVREEEKYDEEVIQQWARQGRLDNAWKISQARQLVQQWKWEQDKKKKDNIFVRLFSRISKIGKRTK